MQTYIRTYMHVSTCISPTHLNIHIHRHTHIYIYIHIHIRIRIRIRIRIHRHIHIYIYTYIYTLSANCTLWVECSLLRAWSSHTRTSPAFTVSDTTLPSLAQTSTASSSNRLRHGLWLFLSMSKRPVDCFGGNVCVRTCPRRSVPRDDGRALVLRRPDARRGGFDQANLPIHNAPTRAARQPPSPSEPQQQRRNGFALPLLSLCHY